MKSSLSLRARTRRGSFRRGGRDVRLGHLVQVRPLRRLLTPPAVVFLVHPVALDQGARNLEALVARAVHIIHCVSEVAAELAHSAESVPLGFRSCSLIAGFANSNSQQAIGAEI